MRLNTETVSLSPFSESRIGMRGLALTNLKLQPMTGFKQELIPPFS